MKSKSLLQLVSCILLMVLAAVIIGSYVPRASGGQYDVIYAIRGTGTGAVLMPYIGSSGTWSTLTTTTTNGVVQTTGSGLTVNAGLMLSSTAAIAAASGTNALPAGLLGLSSSNTAAISTGTAQGFRGVP